MRFDFDFSIKNKILRFFRILERIVNFYMKLGYRFMRFFGTHLWHKTRPECKLKSSKLAFGEDIKGVKLRGLLRRLYPIIYIFTPFIPYTGYIE